MQRELEGEKQREAETILAKWWGAPPMQSYFFHYLILVKHLGDLPLFHDTFK